MLAATKFVFNPSVWIFFVVFAAIAFMRAMRFRQRTGRNPWGIHPVIWLVAGLLFGIIGSLLCLIAVYTSTSSSAKNRGTPGPAGGAWGGPTPTVPYGPGGRTAGMPMPTAPASSAAAGWLPDPAGKFQYRYWSGQAWTANVSTNGVTFTDPVPAAPPGPASAYNPKPSSGDPTANPLPPFRGPTAS